ncbi:hypothetical protein IC757_03440 [Wenzhouxiangella sp. AB-CW3]|uniref:Ig-like domain-containing protein n=1 Tax=Wenzhouxiangella sp. AB-CW3 TaxID=2771012 RepID=UPI00168AA802|nr:Ig-like domain-containing protein [Wenzhouxiangella sp. AB-CW3]QOC23219.1 hypothetical protein IC757_03440 [Wenzhouxiangella sp. AB-CW3]
MDEDFELVIDQAGDGQVRRGDTVEFELTVTNQGSGNALAVDVDNQLPAGLNVDPTSIQVSPLAVDDNYDEIPANNTFTVPEAQGLLSNDRALYPVGGSPPTLSVDVANSDTTTAEGGTVDLQSDGGFDYTPPTDFQGTDSFVYTVITSDGLTDTASVTLEVVEPVWFVSNRSDTGISQCDSAPYGTISSAVADADGIIFVCAADPYNETVTLQSGQKLIGQGEGLEIGGSQIIPAGDRPVITGSGGSDAAVIMASDSEVSGMTIRTNLARAVMAENVIDIRIHNNRFEDNGAVLESNEPLIDVDIGGSGLAGRVDITNNPQVDTSEPGGPNSFRELIQVYVRDGATVWGEVKGNQSVGSDDPWVAKVIYLEAAPLSTLVMRVDDNQIDTDMGGNATTHIPGGIYMTARGGQLHVSLAGNMVRARGDGADLPFIDGMTFYMVADSSQPDQVDFLDGCFNFGTNDVQVSETNMDPDDASEYLLMLASFDFAPMQIQDLGGDDDDTVRNHIQLRELNPPSVVRVLTSDDFGTTFPAASGSFSAGTCLTPEDME